MKSISEVIWSEEAIRNLKDIIYWLELKWSFRELQKFSHKLDRQIEILKKQPFSFPVSRKTNVRRAVISRQTTLYYQIDDGILKIVSLFDNRMNPVKVNI